jgi:hypothetical protein
LPISYLYVETKWRPYHSNTCSNDESTRFYEGVSIIININLMDVYKQKHGSHINTFKINKLMTHSRLLTFNFLLENSLHWKTLYIGKIFRWKTCLNLKMLALKQN